MNKAIAERVLRRLEDNDLPFKFNMANCDTCIMAAVFLEKGETDQPHSNLASHILGIDEDTGRELFLPKYVKLYSEISIKEAAKTLASLIKTGEVVWADHCRKSPEKDYY